MIGFLGVGSRDNYGPLPPSPSIGASCCAIPPAVYAFALMLQTSNGLQVSLVSLCVSHSSLKTRHNGSLLSIARVQNFLWGA